MELKWNDLDKVYFLFFNEISDRVDVIFNTPEI